MDLEEQIEQSSISLEIEDRLGAAPRLRSVRPTKQEMKFDLHRSQSIFGSIIDTNTASEAIQTKIIASLVPDEIIHHLEDRSIRQMDAVFVLGDVSGFTDLSERYNTTGMGGPSRLTDILNGYIGSMVQQILSNKGDVLKFSGDAFLAMWKSETGRTMDVAVTQALDTSLMIQKIHGRYDTDVGITLRVKLAISAGKVSFSSIGEEHMRHYMVLGKTIQDVKYAEHMCEKGNVMVTSQAWRYVDSTEYITKPTKDGHILVLGVSNSWRNTQNMHMFGDDEVDIADAMKEVEARQAAAEEAEMLYSKRQVTDMAPILLMREVADVSSLQVLGASERLNLDHALRPSLNEAVNLKMKEALRPYILPPVMRGVDLGESLEYLTEMRQTVIMFVNVVTSLVGTVDAMGLVDRSYQLVCFYVDERGGCVNKVSMFDKDLMFLCIFGLRGYKHDLESRTGLRCAADVHKVLVALEGVTVASVGVTTGVTYCGVVGHPMRREYTVIGTSVNKAARLMMEYPGRVTCDRETLLQSKLETHQFGVLEQKELKGFLNPGPVYEFNDITPPEDMPNNYYNYPLLDREKELKIFRVLLRELRNSGQKEDLNELSSTSSVIRNVLIFEGEAQIGKTRLLKSTLDQVPSDTRVTQIHLMPRAFKTTCYTIQQLISHALSLPEGNMSNTREERVASFLTASDLPDEMKQTFQWNRPHVGDYLCALNSSLNVTFSLTENYMALDMEQREKLMNDALEIFIRKAFHGKHVLAVDDSEFMDDASWKLLPLLIKPPGVFLVMTIGQRRQVSDPGRQFLKQPWVSQHTLMGIRKWYLAAIACQILEVHAIPAEVEQIIQNRSGGNPGWIQSYLLSLKQAEAIAIRTVPQSELLVMGLVVPDPQQLRVKQTITERVSITGIGGVPSIDANPYREEQDPFWQMYRHCDEGSEDDVLNATTSKHGSWAHVASVPVCTLTASFLLDKQLTDVSMDTVMLRQFDSLNSFEQHLLKCGSVLGECLRRAMLMALLVEPSDIEVCAAVSKLFNLRILCCATDPSTRTVSFAAARRSLDDDTKDPTGQDIVCYCTAVRKSWVNMPKYAGCSYMRFRVPLFRETIYSLLTDNQKKEFHAQAVRYLEWETRRCKSCGSGYFALFHGLRQVVDDPPKLHHPNVTLSPQAAEYFHLRFDHATTSSEADDEDVDEEQGPSYHVEDVNDGKQTWIKSQAAGDRGAQSTSQSFAILGRRSFFSSRASQVIALPLTPSFSIYDFTHCQCSLILATMYTQMLDHCRGAGLRFKILDATLEFAQLCLTVKNLPKAMELLQEALELILFKSEDEEAIIPSWEEPYLLAKVHGLMGSVCLQLGQLSCAERELFLAMKLLGLSFPRNKAARALATIKQTFLLTLTHAFPNQLIGRVKGFHAAHADQVSECLVSMFLLFKARHQWPQAKLAAIWALNKTLESDQSFLGMCVAYANMLEVTVHYRQLKLCQRLENLALDLCRLKTTAVEPPELRAVCRLYCNVFCSRILRAKLSAALSIATCLLHLCTSANTPQIRLQVLPIMVLTLISTRKISSVVELVNDLYYCSIESNDMVGRTWCYALCMTMHLTTGFCALEPQQSLRFYYQKVEELVLLRDQEANGRFMACMWVWHLRRERWDEAAKWQDMALDVPLVERDSAMTRLKTTLFLVEGSLQLAVHCADTMATDVSASWCRKARTMLHIFGNACPTPLAMPWYYLYNAYYLFIRGRKKKAFFNLRKGKKLAETYHQHLAILWIDHQEQVWTGTVSPEKRDFWKQHTDRDKLLFWATVGTTLDVVPFSLPIPRNDPIRGSLIAAHSKKQPL